MQITTFNIFSSEIPDGKIFNETTKEFCSKKEKGNFFSCIKIGERTQFILEKAGNVWLSFCKYCQLTPSSLNCEFKLIESNLIESNYISSLDQINHTDLVNYKNKCFENIEKYIIPNEKNIANIEINTKNFLNFPLKTAEIFNKKNSERCWKTKDFSSDEATYIAECTYLGKDFNFQNSSPRASFQVIKNINKSQIACRKWLPYEDHIGGIYLIVDSEPLKNSHSTGFGKNLFLSQDDFNIKKLRCFSSLFPEYEQARMKAILSTKFEGNTNQPQLIASPLLSSMIGTTTPLLPISQINFDDIEKANSPINDSFKTDESGPIPRLDNSIRDTHSFSYRQLGLGILAVTLSSIAIWKGYQFYSIHKKTIKNNNLLNKLFIIKNK